MGSAHAEVPVRERRRASVHQRACISVRYNGFYVYGTKGSSVPEHEREDWDEDEQCECSCHDEHAEDEEEDWYP